MYSCFITLLHNRIWCKNP